MTTKALAAAALATAIFATAPALAGEKIPKVQDAISFDPRADHDGEANSLIWVNQPDGGRGVHKVIIPFFQVQFITDSKVGASGGGGSHVAMSAHLDGPTPDQMQAITEDLYAAFVLDLQQQGFEVVDKDQAATYGAWSDLVKASRTPGEVIDGMGGVTSAFYSPAGLPYYLLPTGYPQYTGGGMFTPAGDAQIVRSEGALMDQSGAAVLGFRAVVDFATLEATSRKGFGAFRSAGKTEGQAGLVIRPVSTQMFLITPQAKAQTMDPQNRLRLELQAPLEIDSPAVLSMDDVTSKGEKTAEAVAAVIGVLGGYGGNSKRRSYDVRVDPEVWQIDVKDALEGVSSAMVARLKGLV